MLYVLSQSLYENVILLSSKFVVVVQGLIRAGPPAPAGVGPHSTAGLSRLCDTLPEIKLTMKAA